MKDGLEQLMPYIRPIERLLLDEQVSDVLVNADGSVHCERNGALEVCAIRYRQSDLSTAAKRIAREMGRDVSERWPLFVGRLGDGSRVAIVTPPCSAGGTTLAIRKFIYRPLGLDDLVKSGTLTDPQAKALAVAMTMRESVLICGQTGSGKTTLLNALTSYIPAGERIIVIEEVHELALNRANVVYLESREETDEMKGVTAAHLLRQSLWMRPDRIIVGEIRGGEAFTLLQALNSGHSGSLATLHANGCEAALSRLRACVGMAGIDLAPATFATMIAEAIGVVVHMQREGGKRVVASMMRVEGYDRESDRYRMAEL